MTIVCSVIVLSGCQLPFLTGGNQAPRQAASGVGSAARFDQNELSPRQAADACIATAQELEGAGHHREATALYERARRHDPNATDYARRLAVLYELQGDANRARTEYRKALAEDPTNADLLNDFGYFHFGQGDLPQAESHLRHAVELSPGNDRAWTNLGIVLAHQSRYDEAYDAFARTVGPAGAHSNIGAIMAKQGKTDQAQHAFRQALSLNPNLKQPQAFLAYFSRKPPQSEMVSDPSVVPASYTH